MSQTDVCYCCFVETPDSDLHPAEYAVEVDSGRLIAHFAVCTACRRLGCDVPNPEGCKRPENRALAAREFPA